MIFLQLIDCGQEMMVVRTCDEQWKRILIVGNRFPRYILCHGGLPIRPRSSIFFLYSLWPSPTLLLGTYLLTTFLHLSYSFTYFYGFTQSYPRITLYNPHLFISILLSKGFLFRPSFVPPLIVHFALPYLPYYQLRFAPLSLLDGRITIQIQNPRPLCSLPLHFISP